jgi:hypothetical protein
MFEPKLSLQECQALHAMHARVRALDLNSIWAVDDRGHRKGDRLGVQWSEAQVSSEWLEPRAMDDEPHQVYLSKPALNRTKSEYSHQRFTLTLMRKMEHYILILFLPFFGLTSAMGVAYGVPEGDYNARLTILGSFFVASLALRYISVQYLPHVSYATLLDWYIQACLFFTLAGVAETVVAYVLYFPSPAPPSFSTAQSSAGAGAGAAGAAAAPATVSVYADNPSPKTHTAFDTFAWTTLLVLWLLTNLFFVLVFTHNYVKYTKLQRQQEERLQRRRDLVLGLHPLRAREESSREEVRIPWRKSAEVARMHCCRAGSSQSFRVSLWDTLCLLLSNVRSLCVYLLILVDALLLCRCGAKFIGRWRDVERHAMEHHQRHLQERAPGKAHVYLPHEYERLYSMSTRKNRSA